MVTQLVTQVELSLIHSCWAIVARGTQKPHREIPAGFLKNLAVPTFALVGTIIGLESLTTVFGMGTGVAFPVCSPEEERRTVRHGALNLVVARVGQGVRNGDGDDPAREARCLSFDMPSNRRAFDKCGQAIVR